MPRILPALRPNWRPASARWRPCSTPWWPEAQAGQRRQSPPATGLPRGAAAASMGLPLKGLGRDGTSLSPAFKALKGVSLKPPRLAPAIRGRLPVGWGGVQSSYEAWPPRWQLARHERASAQERAGPGPAVRAGTG